MNVYMYICIYAHLIKDVFSLINLCICFRHPFTNTEGKFNMLKVLTGKYDLIERKDIDERLKGLCYRMIKLVMIYGYIYIFIRKLNIYI
jgi:hypothetical protein